VVVPQPQNEEAREGEVSEDSGADLGGEREGEKGRGRQGRRDDGCGAAYPYWRTAHCGCYTKCTTKVPIPQVEMIA
jgi:hypothetical protein